MRLSDQSRAPDPSAKNNFCLVAYAFLYTKQRRHKSEYR
jgi:hypothetical protein